MLEKALAGPIGVFVKFSTLQEYGVDRVFLLENNNVDSSQRNVVFLAHGEKASHAQAIAGMYVSKHNVSSFGCLSFHFGQPLGFCSRDFFALRGWDLKVDCVDVSHFT